MSKLKRNILSLALFVMATCLTLLGVWFGMDGAPLVASAATNTTATVQTEEGTKTYQLFNSGRTGNGYNYSSGYNYNTKSLTNGGYDLYAESWGSAPATIQLGLPIKINYDVTEKATLTIYAYDVDSSSRERVYIYLVDETTNTRTRFDDYMTGMDSQWNTSTYAIAPTLFTTGHTYHFELNESVEGWFVWVRTVSLSINGKQLENVITESDFSASISSSGTVTTTLYLKTKETRTYTLEYAARTGTSQYGSANTSVTVSSSGITKPQTFNLQSSAPKGTYVVEVIVKDSNGNNVTTLSASAGYSYYSVNYNANGGSNNLPTDKKSYSSGAYVTVLFDYVPSKEGYVFQGWSTNRNATTATYTKTGTKNFYISQDTTLYAVWAPEHTHDYKVEKVSCNEYVYYKCSCGESYYDYNNVLGHDWQFVMSEDAAGCGESGYRLYECSNCGEDKYEIVSAPSHEWTLTATTDATCTENGTNVYTCAVCGETKSEGIPAYGHNWKNEATYVEATCTTDAYVEVTCAVCGVEDIVVDTNTALGHSFADGEYVVIPDCTTPGVLRFACVNDGCDYSYDEFVTADHSAYLTVVDREEATCTENGSVSYKCNACGDEYQEVIEALGHAYAYTDNEDGTHTAVCGGCADTFTEKHDEGRRVCVCGYRNGAYIEILLIQDSQPWTTDSNENVLENLKKEGYIDAWTKCSTSDVLNGKVILANYSLVLFANDQTTSTYNKYAQFADDLATYVEQGGALVFGACDGGWRGGDLTAALPGGATTGWQLDYNNQITDANNAIVTGENTDGKALVNDDLRSTYCSHVYFNNLPENANVIFENTNGNPTLVEYAYGNGYVIASGLTWEYSVIYCSYADFADIAYDDMIVTALSNVEAYAHDRVVVEFVDENGELVKAERVDKDGNVITPEPPEKEGYEFAGWDVDGDGIVDYVDEIPAIVVNMTITVVFEIKCFEVKVNAGANGVAIGGETAEYGSQIVLVATPNAGYVFDGWYLNGKLISIELTFIYTIGASDVEIDCVFRNVSVVAKVETAPAKPSYSEGEEISVNLNLEKVSADKEVKSYQINSMSFGGYSLFDITIVIRIQIILVNAPEGWVVVETANGFEIVSQDGSALVMPEGQIVIQVSFTLNVEEMDIQLPYDFDVQTSGSAITVDGAVSEMQFSSAKVRLNCAHKNTRVENRVESTCSVAGVSGDEYCETCGELVKASEALELAAHNYEYFETIAATCEREGYEYEKCTVCNDIHRAQIFEALGHQEVIVEGVEMTCTTNGVTEGRYCTRCNEWLAKQEELFAHPEAVRVVEGVEATCETDGLTEGKYCDHCQKWIIEQEVIEAGHIESDWLPVEEGDEVTEEHKVCERCGEELDRRKAGSNITDVLAGFVGLDCSGSIVGLAGLPSMVTLIGVGFLMSKKNRKNDE